MPIGAVKSDAGTVRIAVDLAGLAFGVPSTLLSELAREQESEGA
jgi:hypothetical protein